MNGWKVTAIVLMVLLICETVLIFWAVSVASDDIDKDNECVYNVCGDAEYDSYIYDIYTNLCECYTSGELIKTEYLT